VYVLAVPASFILLFLKMWNDLGSIPWWIVAVVPASVLTRTLVDHMCAVIIDIPKVGLLDIHSLGFRA